LDALVERLLSRPGQQLTPQLRSLAVVGLCQLLYTSIPSHAAVAETVNATRLIGEPRASGFLNAILRRFQREGAQLCASVDADIAIRTSHPRWLVDALSSDWPARSAAILDANNERPAFWLRVNRLRCSGAEYRERLAVQGMTVAAVGHTPETLLLDKAVDVHQLPGFSEGWVSVQDAAAQLAAHLVAPRPKERILDACAAPGGKSCHLLELQPELGELVAVDVSAARLVRIEENLSRLGLRARLIAGDAADPAAWWDGKPFDRILLDVPCSATGVIRRHPDIKLLRRPEDIVTLAQRQGRLLWSMWPLLAPGGRLVYASCSALSAENSAVIAEFLGKQSQAREVTARLVAQLGLPAAGGIGYAIAAGTAAMDGFYYACLEKFSSVLPSGGHGLGVTG
jgi:16S rRNA (cytosine967-C5)-methyltransferase